LRLSTLFVRVLLSTPSSEESARSDAATSGEPVSTDLTGEIPPCPWRHGGADRRGGGPPNSRVGGGVRPAGPTADVATPFVAELLARHGAVWVREASRSMSPLIREGDEVRLGVPEPQRITQGALIACRQQGGLVLHRVLASSEAGVITKGDALASPDPPVGWEDVVARVTALRRAGMPLADLDRFPWPLVNRLLGALSAIAGRFHIEEDIGGMPPLLPRLAWKALRVPFHLARCLVP
jgi:hypothetical protein